MYQEFKLYTASGIPFKYRIKVGKNGGYNKELIIDRRTDSKTLTWSSILLAFGNALKVNETVVSKPKALGDIRGVSYIYPIFYKLGLIEVPEKIATKMCK